MIFPCQTRAGLSPAPSLFPLPLLDPGVGGKGNGARGEPGRCDHVGAIPIRTRPSATACSAMKRPPLLPFVLAAAVVIILGCACSLEATRVTRCAGSHGAACQPFSSLGQQPLPIIRGPVGLLSPPPFDSRVVAVHTANGFFGRSNPAPHIRWGDDCARWASKATVPAGGRSGTPRASSPARSNVVVLGVPARPAWEAAQGQVQWAKAAGRR